MRSTAVDNPPNTHTWPPFEVAEDTSSSVLPRKWFTMNLLEAVVSLVFCTLAVARPNTIVTGVDAES